MGYVTNPPGSGYPPERTLTDLGVLREGGTAEDQQDEGLGISRMGRARLSRGGRAFGTGAAIRRRRAFTATAASRETSAQRRARFGGRTPTRLLGRRARQRRYAAQKRRTGVIGRLVGGAKVFRRPTTTAPARRRGGIGGMVARMRERARALRAKQEADRARLVSGRPPMPSRSHIWTGTRWVLPTVTDRGGWGRPRRDPGLCAGVGPPSSARGWICYQGKRWRRQMPGGGWADQGPQTPPDVGIAIACSPPTPPRPGMRCVGGRWYPPPGEVMNGAPWPKPPDGTEVEKIPTTRPWWQGRAPDGEIPLRDTSGIPTPPGLPGGPSMRPPASGPEDTATERVPSEEPAAGMDMAKILPLVAGAALLFMGKG